MQVAAVEHLVGKAQPVLQVLRVVSQLALMRIRVRADDAAALLRMAIDAFGPDKIGKPGSGLVQLAIDGRGVFHAMMGLEPAQGAFQRPAQETGIAPGGTFAQPLLVEDGDGQAMTGELQRRDRSGHTAPDDGHVDGSADVRRCLRRLLGGAANHQQGISRYSSHRTAWSGVGYAATPFGGAWRKSILPSPTSGRACAFLRRPAPRGPACWSPGSNQPVEGPRHRYQPVAGIG